MQFTKISLESRLELKKPTTDKIRLLTSTECQCVIINFARRVEVSSQLNHAHLEHVIECQFTDLQVVALMYGIPLLHILDDYK